MDDLAAQFALHPAAVGDEVHDAQEGEGEDEGEDEGDVVVHGKFLVE